MCFRKECSEEPDCPCSETKHSGSFIHECDKERTWLKNIPQKSIGQYQMNHHFSLARDKRDQSRQMVIPPHPFLSDGV